MFRDLLAGLDAGSIDYVQAPKALKIQFLEGLRDPLVGAVPIDKIDVPPALTINAE